MASGKVRSPAALDFRKLTVPFLSMPLTCLLNVPLVLIWMSKPSLPGDFNEHFSRDPFPVQEFLFLFIE